MEKAIGYQKATLLVTILTLHVLAYSSCQLFSETRLHATKQGTNEQTQVRHQEIEEKLRHDYNLHFLMIHGGGPRIFTRMIDLDTAMQKSGIDARRVHLLHYNHNHSLEQISNELASQMRGIISSVDPNVTFDVIAHSLGDFVGLHALVTNSLEHRVGRFIALAGVKFGQDSKPFFCWFGCSDVYHFLTPFRNPDLLRFHETHHGAIASLDHCAIWSKDDWLVNDPANAGEYPAGRTLVVRKIGHTSLHTAKVWPLILAACYN